MDPPLPGAAYITRYTKMAIELRYAVVRGISKQGGIFPFIAFPWLRITRFKKRESGRIRFFSRTRGKVTPVFNVRQIEKPSPNRPVVLNRPFAASIIRRADGNRLALPHAKSGSKDEKKEETASIYGPRRGACRMPMSDGKDPPANCIR